MSETTAPKAASGRPPRQAGPHPHPAADGGDRVRGSGPGHRARALRQLRSARHPAQPVRRLARRQQGQQRAEGGALSRAGGPRLQVRARRSAQAAHAGHRALGLQPLPGGGGVQGQPGVPERSRQRAPPGHGGGVRPVVHRRGADLRPAPRTSFPRGCGRGCCLRCWNGCAGPAARCCSCCWPDWGWCSPAWRCRCSARCSWTTCWSAGAPTG